MICSNNSKKIEKFKVSIIFVLFNTDRKLQNQMNQHSQPIIQQQMKRIHTKKPQETRAFSTNQQI